MGLQSNPTARLPLMKPLLKFLVAAAVLGLALHPSPGLAQAFNFKDPESMVASLDSALGLTESQKTQAMDIVQAAIAGMEALPEADRLEQGAPIREHMRRQIRAILTPEQQKIYDRTPQAYGGGLTMMTPENQVARLNTLVPLTDAQKAVALKIFDDELEALLAIPEADRPAQGAVARRAALADVRAILTPEQQKTYDRTPQSNGGGLTLMSPENKLARLNALVALTDAQKAVALKIFDEELEALLAIPEADRPAQGAVARRTALADIRVILTPEQQKIFDATPQSRGSGHAGPTR